jgi:hypothetical protein
VRNDMNTLAPLEDLLRQAQRLQPSWERPEAFHIQKSSLVRGLKDLIASGNVSAPPVTPRLPLPTPAAPAPAPAPTPLRILAVSPATPTTTGPLTVTLSPDRVERLLDLATRPNPNRRRGYQKRLAGWLDSLDEQRGTLTLTGGDVLWLRRQLINGQGGGWQRAHVRIFTGSHAHFSNLPLQPRKKRSRRWGRRDAGRDAAAVGSASTGL